ncbi:hypothetical protein BDN72DRAFT_465775 [Pluteus cervinus]|uniref:Uncharacterized protein n=1 Tax=Pluteus cervinus TaxID=181527 RepID=A0ACD3A6J2_9AGAR|nr:hypothetical protein BDN72DRAFT_465775 [Pluteus cervinus]
MASLVSSLTWDPALLDGNAIYCLGWTTNSGRPTPPHLDGSSDHIDIVFMVQRKPVFTGPPSFSSIVFSIGGVVGPYIHEIMNKEVTLDRPSDAIFAEYPWSTTKWQVDWPGLASRSGRISIRNLSGTPRTRLEFAQVLSEGICKLIGKPSEHASQGPDDKDMKPEDLYRTKLLDPPTFACLEPAIMITSGFPSLRWIPNGNTIPLTLSCAIWFPLFHVSGYFILFSFLR